MKFLLILVLISAVCTAQEPKNITIRVSANNIPDGSLIYISGNLPELGNWNPGKISLINTSGNIWEKTFLISEGKKIEYKITRGSWNTEAVNKNGDIPGNSSLIIKNDTIIEMRLSYWEDQFDSKKESDYKLSGQVTGRVDYYKNVKGKGILPRDILIWLPPDYENDTAQRYPVLYMEDGQNLFDPQTASFGVDWQLDETADSMIKNGSIKPLIIVGLTNTDHRSAEYSDNDTGRAYMKFVIEKVKPFVDSNYRTLTGAENTATGGSSLGALISFILGWNYPDIFSKIICVSPALKISDIDFVKNVNEYTGERKKLKFYFDTGGDSLDSQLKTGTLEMINALENKGYKKNEDILWYEDKNGKHNEASWAKRVWRPLIFFWANKKDN